LPVDVNTLLDKSSVIVELNLPGGITLLDPNEKITVSYKVEETVELTQQFTLDQVSFINLEEGLEIQEFDTQLVYTVVIKGYKSLIEELEFVEMFKPTIDLSGLETGSHTLDIGFSQIPNLEIETLVPDTAIINLIEQ
jgi:YbbR domain-containing protein